MKFIKPLLLTFLFFAVLHVIVMVFLILLTGDIAFINVFTVVGLDYFFPNIGKGTTSQILSNGILIAVYIFFYLKNKKK